MHYLLISITFDIFLIFRTLNELVLHYAVNSLEEHNDQLRTALKFPINAHLVKKPDKKVHDTQDSRRHHDSHQESHLRSHHHRQWDQRQALP